MHMCMPAPFHDMILQCLQQHTLCQASDKHSANTSFQKLMVNVQLSNGSLGLQMHRGVLTTARRKNRAAAQHQSTGVEINMMSAIHQPTCSQSAAESVQNRDSTSSSYTWGLISSFLYVQIIQQKQPFMQNHPGNHQAMLQVHCSYNGIHTFRTPPQCLLLCTNKQLTSCCSRVLGVTTMTHGALPRTGCMSQL